MSSLSVDNIENVFLLNPDGSAPNGIDIASLQAAGVRVVVPTEVPREYGKVAYEREPVLRPDGLYQQVWELKELEPEHNTAPEPVVRTPGEALEDLYRTLGLDTEEKQAAFRAMLASGLK